MSHEERIQLQNDVQSMKDEKLEKCIPSLPLKGQRFSHFYNDREKFRLVFNKTFHYAHCIQFFMRISSSSFRQSNENR